MASPDMDQPQRGRRDREMNDLPAEKAPGAGENIRGVGDEEDEFEEELESVEEFDAEDDPFPSRRAAGGDPFFAALDQTPDTIHPMAKLFATLWNERVHGGIIEINLEDGVTLVPDWWAQRLSLEAYGVFATQTADGSYVMEAVAWDHVKRVTVRRITELPDGVFE